MRPFTVTTIDHIVLRVSDLDRSIAFYEGVLGCRVDRRRENLGLTHLRAGGAMIDLVDVNGPLGGTVGAAGEERNVDHFCLRVDPFDEQAIVAHLARSGVRVEAPAMKRYGAEGNGLSLYCFDPDGNRVELKGPSDPA